MDNRYPTLKFLPKKTDITIPEIKNDTNHLVKLQKKLSTVYGKFYIEKAVEIAYHTWQISPFRIRGMRRLLGYWIRSLFRISNRYSNAT